jgi:predicted RNA-binding Zn-ribbon protein involved in translation (DUF1610 family)
MNASLVTDKIDDVNLILSEVLRKLLPGAEHLQARQEICRALKVANEMLNPDGDDFPCPTCGYTHYSRSDSECFICAATLTEQVTHICGCTVTHELRPEKPNAEFRCDDCSREDDRYCRDDAD